MVIRVVNRVVLTIRNSVVVTRLRDIVLGGCDHRRESGGEDYIIR